MPYQVSWQFVSIKSQGPVHVLGAEAAAAGEAIVGTLSAAHASVSHAAPAAARIVTTKMPSFVMGAPLAHDDCMTIVTQEARSTSHSRPHMQLWRKNSNHVVAALQCAATVFAKALAVTTRFTPN